MLAALLFFGLIIATHETGHFLMAKLFKVRVNEFSIGMGPTVWKRKKAETQYSLRLLPVGGYVAMEG
ncbi:MAG: site-2 protease family protein, partial [Clostridia bacterium]|nr:site-2 protease family protein [Clostridia bacterium]